MESHWYTRDYSLFLALLTKLLLLPWSLRRATLFSGHMGNVDDVHERLLWKRDRRKQALEIWRCQSIGKKGNFQREALEYGIPLIIWQVWIKTKLYSWSKWQHFGEWMKHGGPWFYKGKTSLIPARLNIYVFF